MAPQSLEDAYPFFGSHSFYFNNKIKYLLKEQSENKFLKYINNNSFNLLMKQEEVLHEWLKEYIKHRNLMKQDILKLDDKPTIFSVEYKSKKHKYLIITDPHKLTDDLDLMKDNTHLSLIVPNQKEFVEAMIKSWDKLIVSPMLSIFFVNPHAQGEKKWIIYPCTHNSISDKASLKTGLMSLFEGVEAYI